MHACIYAQQVSNVIFFRAIDMYVHAYVPYIRTYVYVWLYQLACTYVRMYVNRYYLCRIFSVRTAVAFALSQLNLIEMLKFFMKFLTT